MYSKLTKGRSQLNIRFLVADWLTKNKELIVSGNMSLNLFTDGFICAFISRSNQDQKGIKNQDYYFQV